MLALSEAAFVVVDTETTGLDPKEHRIVEIAAVITDYSDILGMWATLVNPDMLIPPETSAVHMLTDDDVRHAPNLGEAMAAFDVFSEFPKNPLIAHNAAFDSSFLPCSDATWICTRRLAAHLWPEAPNHRNQTLRYWRGLRVDTFGIMPHRALGDALVTAALLRDILTCGELEERGIQTVEQLAQFSASPIRVKTWPFGKHFGKPLECDISYALWAIGNLRDMDPDLKWSLQQTIKEHA